MTISSTTRKAGPFTGNGVTTAFPFTFKVFAAADILAVEAVLATGVQTTLVLGTDYTVALNADQDNNPGGTVNMVVAPTALQSLTITSAIGLLQQVVLTNLGGFYPTVINAALDRLTIFAQQLQEQVSRSLKLALSTSSSIVPTVTATPGGVLIWDNAGQNIITTPQATLAANLVYNNTTYQAAIATTLTQNNLWSGINTFSGNNVFSGNNSLSGNNAFSGANTLSGSITGTAPAVIDMTLGTLTVKTQAPEDSSTKAASTALLHSFTPRGFIDGLAMSAAGASTTISIAAGFALDSTNTAPLALAAAITKTTSAWTVGSGNGCVAPGETVQPSVFYHKYLIRRTDTGVVDVLASQAPDTAATFTITLASPGVVTQANHGLEPGAPWVPTTTGALPTGLVAGTTYFVKTVTDQNTFTVSATQGGAAINTSVGQSGVHTGTSAPAMPASYTQRRYIGAWGIDGSSKWLGGVQEGDRVTLSTPITYANSLAVVGGTGITVSPVVGAPRGRPIILHHTFQLADTSGASNPSLIFSYRGTMLPVTNRIAFVVANGFVSGWQDLPVGASGLVGVNTVGAAAYTGSVTGYSTMRGKNA